MSSTVHGYGVIAKLKKRLPVDLLDGIHNRLIDGRSGCGINYEGTLAYIDMNANKPLQERKDVHHLMFFPLPIEIMAKLSGTMAREGIDLELFGARWFSCVWYTGSDRPMDEFTLADFDKVLKP